MVVSVHIADLGLVRAVRLLRQRVDAPGLTWAQLAATAPLRGQRGRLPRPGRVALIAAWENEESVERFMSGHSVAHELADGGHIRMRPVRTVGSWTPMAGIEEFAEEMEPNEQAAVLTLGRMRIRRALPFFRASGPAEKLAVDDPVVEYATALARPPRFVATFSIWNGVDAMRDYSTGRNRPGHRDAMRAHAANPFHHEAAFIRFRPYARAGEFPAV